jgi:tRNA G18 (ribose-2'-O)-methylase SpoU
MPLIRIDDPGDPRLDDYRNVPDAELLERRGIFIAEGRLVVRRLLTTSRFEARSVMVTPVACDALSDLLADSPLPIFIVSQALMNGISGFNIHRGCLAVGERRAARDWQTVCASASRVVVLERVGNADNVGAIFRNATAFGADAVLLGPSCADPLYRKAIRTSMAAALSLPFAPLAPWPAALDDMRAAGFLVLGLTPRSSADLLSAVAERTVGGRCALVLGHEGEGLTVEALAACDRAVRIPVTGAVDSLNVATAAAVALYELGRLRPTGITP